MFSPVRSYSLNKTMLKWISKTAIVFDLMSREFPFHLLDASKIQTSLNFNYSVKRELHLIEYACMLWIKVSIRDLQAINWIWLNYNTESLFTLEAIKPPAPAGKLFLAVFIFIVSIISVYSAVLIQRDIN